MAKGQIIKSGALKKIVRDAGIQRTGYDFYPVFEQLVRAQLVQLAQSLAKIFPNHMITGDDVRNVVQVAGISLSVPDADALKATGKIKLPEKIHPDILPDPEDEIILDKVSLTTLKELTEGDSGD